MYFSPPTHPHAHSNVSALHKLMSPFQTSTLNLGSHVCLLFLARKLQFQGIDTFTQTIAISLCSYHQDGTTSTTIILNHTLMISPLEQPLNFLAHTDSVKHKHGTESMHQLPVPDRDFCPFCPGIDISTQCRQPLDRTLLYLNKEKEQNQPQYTLHPSPMAACVSSSQCRETKCMALIWQKDPTSSQRSD